MLHSISPNLGVLETIKFFFRFEPKQTETQSVTVVFRFVSRNKKHFFGLFRFLSVFRIGIETTETNKTLSKQTEKISQKRSLLGGPQNCSCFFLVQTETNRNSICFCCISVCFFSKPPKKFFRFVSVLRTGIETTKTNRNYGMGN